MVQIVAIHMTANGSLHEHIDSVKWIDIGTNQQGITSRAGMVAFIEKGGTAIVSDGMRSISVGVIHATKPYIKTFADGVWTDNLLALPRF